MNYYEIYDRYSGELLTRGNAAECRKALGCASLDGFYALANPGAAWDQQKISGRHQKRRAGRLPRARQG